MPAHEISSNLQTFVTAGNALFTVVNESTGNRFTFKVCKADKRQPADPDRWFVKVLNGPDNYSNYRYLGMLTPDGKFVATTATGNLRNAQSFKAFDWFWRHIANLPANVKVYHEGKCARCGRRLTVPESIESGYGPECIQMVFAA